MLPLLSLLLFLLLQGQPVAADIPAVVNVNVNGVNHQVTELIAHNKSLLNKQPEEWRYKLLDSPYTLVIHKKEYEANKKLLKYVPDYRDFYTKHPWIQKIMFIGNSAGLIIDILSIARI
jgi:hypothetical protein